MTQTGNNIHCSGVHFWWSRPGISAHNQVPVSCAEYVAALERKLVSVAGTDVVKLVRQDIFNRLDALYSETANPTSKSDTQNRWCPMCRVRPPRHEEAKFCRECYEHLLGGRA
jgi:hypothetical protein